MTFPAAQTVPIAGPAPSLESTNALHAHGQKSLFRFITCGSVDDGKSTLIGRLLFESGALLEDQLSALARDSVRHGTQGQQIDYALLLDGLEAERQQGITIDVAYRFFSTQHRKFIVADCPGHVQYTRNMATGASTADAAIVLVDARKGISAQTLRHSQILALLGVPNVVLAINKLDQIGYSEAGYQKLVTDYRDATRALGFTRIEAVPLSALHGDNLLHASANTPWYSGPSLLALLESLPARATLEQREHAHSKLRFPVQWVCRPHQDFRGFAGTIAGGELKLGQRLQVLGKKHGSAIRQILRGDRPVSIAQSGDSVLISLADELDISRGDVLVAATDESKLSRSLCVKLLWMSDRGSQPGSHYLLKLAGKQVSATLSKIISRVHFHDQPELDASQQEGTLELNQLAECELVLSEAIAAERYSDNRTLGSLILIDRANHSVAAAGVIIALLSGNQPDMNLVGADHQQHGDFSSAPQRKKQRAALKQQSPGCYWFTGISGAGKTTLTQTFEQALHAAGRHTFVLDGDLLRQGLSSHLGLSREDRAEQARLVSEVAKLMTDAGLIVLVSLISPYAEDRALARSRFSAEEFVEVYVDAPLATVQQRDPKGLYAQVAQGKLQNFTGVDAPYEAPLAPEVHLLTSEYDINALVQQLMQFEKQRSAQDWRYRWRLSGSSDGSRGD